ncbi:EKC/KEOPS complex subunit LAGE3-like [Vombatus ursinus]|uniref:EKC/KEOPS complex subunit LAGE3-like n=1 Tax=Vombatus ursinus TaxID=29139 RepID=UPI000FFD4860|nr:EKC/KEOPS complex subunit LAGE3-like [Vombatus ursinus]XP_027723296.1 EKC/KEOPS complex subunit LAGE3-like [Vombatus ursinus]XP_027723353.1 EKC/KEOPS complex subunit LAGE3-like [Vombatus ursinus]XP_027723354.1 EKC/KEOPS complex subunit LAGE3-like [Vombatus ursinus]
MEASIQRPRHPGPGGDSSSTIDSHGRGFYDFSLSIPFPSPLEAEIACRSLDPDPEPRRSGVQRELTVIGNKLVLHWRAEEARFFRASITTFLDYLALVLQTMERFGPPEPH